MQFLTDASNLYHIKIISTLINDFTGVSRTCVRLGLDRRCNVAATDVLANVLNDFL